MATPTVASILLVPGRLAVAPTDLTLAWPHGGTGLGLVQDVVLRSAREFTLLHEEGHGPAEVVDALDLGEGWVLGATSRTLDEDMIGKVFAATAAGASSDKRNIAYPGAFRAGTLRSAAAVKLLFTPDDPDRHPFIILYSALPFAAKDAEIQLSRAKEATFTTLFFGTRDGTDRIVRVGPKEDIAL